MANILIPTPLRKFTDNTSKVQLEGQTVLEALQNLTSKFPDIKPYLLEEDQIKPYIKLFRGEDDIEGLNQEKTKLSADDTLSIVPAIAGGKENINHV